MAASETPFRGGPDLRIDALRRAYRDGALSPPELVETLPGRIAAYDDPALWIDLLPEEVLLDRARALAELPSDSLPLFGIPFAVKDNMDVAGRPTTAGCPDFAYVAEETAPAVARLIEAGAILIGKTNLDQFATGLIGMRSPYGVPRNPVAPGCIPGGSSSGSAAAVAAGLVSLALGTDTAGSGRVPAAFNNIVGLKPTRGLVSTRGVVPACRSLDCVSVFALSCDDATAVRDCLAGYDPADPYARRAPVHALAFPDFSHLRVGIPGGDFLDFRGDAGQAALFADALGRLQALGASVAEIDFAPFAEAAALLYSGPWVAERYAAVGAFLDAQPESVHPVTRGIIGAGRDVAASDLFAAQHRLAALAKRADEVLDRIDVLAMPTAPTIYTVEEVEADPVRVNSTLGTYTNFVNLLDLAAIAVPAGFTESGRPGGISLIGPAWSDAALAELGGALHAAAGIGAGAIDAPVPAPTASGRARASKSRVLLAVNGAHMRGLSLNHELRALGARFAFAGRTAPAYRLYLMDGLSPARPGLVRSPVGGAIALEVWDLPLDTLGVFVNGIPSPFCIGTVELSDGQEVKGFLCEATAVRGCVDITEFGGWRARPSCWRRSGSSIPNAATGRTRSSCPAACASVS